MASDPYESSTSMTSVAADGARIACCPRCRSSNLHAPRFTWWGGPIGPHAFHHRVCRACGLGFDARTGRSNRTKIVVYTMVMFVLVLVIGLGLQPVR
jgi:hypothetical protein